MIKAVIVDSPEINGRRRVRVDNLGNGFSNASGMGDGKSPAIQVTLRERPIVSRNNGQPHINPYWTRRRDGQR